MSASRSSSPRTRTSRLRRPNRSTMPSRIECVCFPLHRFFLSLTCPICRYSSISALPLPLTRLIVLSHLPSLFSRVSRPVFFRPLTSLLYACQASIVAFTHTHKKRSCHLSLLSWKTKPSPAQRRLPLRHHRSPTNHPQVAARTPRPPPRPSSSSSAHPPRYSERKEGKEGLALSSKQPRPLPPFEKAGRKAN